MAEENKNLTYAQRAELSSNALSKKLFKLMETKETNLCIAADLSTCEEVLKLADDIGPHICVFKTHVDVIDDYTPDFNDKLSQLAEKHNFFIFEDRKFADIGNTVKHQYSGGVYRISSWAHITNAHPVPGPGIIDGLKEVGLPLERGLLLLAEMSSSGSLATGDYTKATIEMAKNNKDFVFGFVGARCFIEDDPSFITMTPGIKLVAGTDALGQQYRTPELIITENKSDIIIVGRGIYKADNRLEAAQKYRDAGWKAYKARL